MSFWSVDLSRWGDTIRKWFPLARELAQRGSVLRGLVYAHVDEVGLPTTHHDLTCVQVTLSITVNHRELADLVRCEPVKMRGDLSAKLPVFKWPNLSSDGHSIRLEWPVGTRASINVPALSPLVSAVTIGPDGTGSIEIQRGPDGTITY